MAEKPMMKALSLEDLLEKHDEKMRSLFLKVMNAHAAYQVSPRTDSELLSIIRNALKKCCDDDE